MVESESVNAAELECSEPKSALPDDEFKEQLAAVIPHLRAFARSLSGYRDIADDLVGETLLKAWAARDRFEAGTNIRAWTFIILRNLFLSQMRRVRFQGEWDERAAANILVTPATQEGHIELAYVQRALMQLPQLQREALILVSAAGFAYEEAAEICGCAVGTVKSRVARARMALERLLREGTGARTAVRTTKSSSGSYASVMRVLMGEVEPLIGHLAPARTASDPQPPALRRAA